RKVFGLTRFQVNPSFELHTSLLQMRGKCSRSSGFQPPKSHIRPLKTRAPAPSRGAKAAFFVTLTQRYVGGACCPDTFPPSDSSTASARHMRIMVEPPLSMPPYSRSIFQTRPVRAPHLFGNAASRNGPLILSGSSTRNGGWFGLPSVQRHGHNQL